MFRKQTQSCDWLLIPFFLALCLQHRTTIMAYPPPPLPIGIIRGPPPGLAPPPLLTLTIKCIKTAETYTVSVPSTGQVNAIQHAIQQMNPTTEKMRFHFCFGGSILQGEQRLNDVRTCTNKSLCSGSTLFVVFEGNRQPDMLHLHPSIETDKTATADDDHRFFDPAFAQDWLRESLLNPDVPNPYRYYRTRRYGFPWHFKVQKKPRMPHVVRWMLALMPEEIDKGYVSLLWDGNSNTVFGHMAFPNVSSKDIAQKILQNARFDAKDEHTAVKLGTPDYCKSLLLRPGSRLRHRTTSIPADRSRSRSRSPRRDARNRLYDEAVLPPHPTTPPLPPQPTFIPMPPSVAIPMTPIHYTTLFVLPIIQCGSSALQSPTPN